MIHAYRLIAPRPTFAQDMTEHEAAVMGEHAAYWHDLVDRGTAVLFGPVADPAGFWGLAVVETGSDDEAVRVRDGDPAVAQGVCRGEMHPMIDPTLRKDVPR
ncbi:YciI family protein [Actinomycetospora termitidis]|uniref:YciI family protein n=1 Tax=Actinomycetospora termitidis TaxID=3053470 RepID=A0ABT7M9Q2_9PSEU|nr:YciI family protein [Actinomycetospora sp. Odt1-22]MDL5156762.1 YciI family protein [Actinomycetospora sp. Odt1-22]